jgi:succinate dehydrogenase/fumarate reductase flavoprotein subunit
LSLFGRRGYASQSDEHDLVIIGGGVAGYVAAIKAGQEGLKVRFSFRSDHRKTRESAFPADSD